MVNNGAAWCGATLDVREGPVAMQQVVKLIGQERERIAELWLDRLLQSFGGDAQGFFRRERNTFANPVGNTFARELRALVDALADNKPWTDLTHSLDEILRIRAVQDTSPAQAVGFVFVLKDVLREVLQVELVQPELQQELRDLDAQVDRMALLVFDLYSRHRDKVAQLRIDDVKRRVSNLIKRTGYFEEDAPPPENEGSEV
ncbi:MAG: RsbRD N-terminal domain-containing protein [Pseudomonadota bacterium]